MIIAFSYAYVSATIYLDNYEQGVSNVKKYYRKHFVLIQKEIDKHIGKIVLNNLRKLLETNNFNAENVQKMLLLLVANLMTYYYELLKYAKNIFENKDNSAYYKLINKFKKLKNLILKDKMQDIIDFDFRYLSVCRIIIEQFNTVEGVPKLKPSEVNDFLLNRIIESVYFVDENMKNEFEEAWLKRNLSSLFIKSSKLKPNDFLDYEILRELFYYIDVDLLITFDGKMIKIMDDIKNNEKFKNSIELIKSFEIS